MKNKTNIKNNGENKMEKRASKKTGTGKMGKLSPWTQEEYDKKKKKIKDEKVNMKWGGK